MFQIGGYLNDPKKKVNSDDAQSRDMYPMRSLQGKWGENINFSRLASICCFFHFRMASELLIVRSPLLLSSAYF
jgi:hypothetical protein